MLFIIIVTAAEARQFANAYRVQKKHTAFSFQKKAVEAAENTENTECERQ